MPKKLPWTDAQDAQIRRLRAEGADWDGIAALLGLTRWAVIERGRRIGARLPPADFIPAPEDLDRDPHPPGHPLTWGAITAGTVLADTPYPIPDLHALIRRTPVPPFPQEPSPMPLAPHLPRDPETGTIPELDDAYVIWRLEEAGATLLAMPDTGWSTRLRSSSLDIVRSAAESYGWTEGRLRPPMPSAAKITRMDAALGWIALIPLDRYVLRRIVGARALVHPITDRHLFPWRRLGAVLGADHKAVQRWHKEGISLIVAGLRQAMAA